MNRSRLVATALVVAVASMAWAQEVPATPEEGTTPTLTEMSRFSGQLIYSVNRTPERTFETSRPVVVVTGDDIMRRSPRGLADILAETAGVYLNRQFASGGSAVIRGLSGRQVLIMVDGVKLTNGSWGTRDQEYLNLIDPSQIDRVEIVRGVLSVLGTESLGGIINIITRKGPPHGETVSATAGMTYSSADKGIMVPVTLSGQSERFRYFTGVTFHTTDDLRAGGDIGVQPVTDYKRRSGFASLQYMLSADKTVELMYVNTRLRGVRQLGPCCIGPVAFQPATAQLARLTLLDVTERAWADSARVAAYWNRQSKGFHLNLVVPPVFADHSDGNRLFGFGASADKYFGTRQGHHVVYGADYSNEKTESAMRWTVPGTDHVVLDSRSDTIPGSRYQTVTVYVNDRVELGPRVTASLGARYGRYSLKAHEIGEAGLIDIDNSKSDFAAAFNLVYHATPSLNFVANAIRGFRTPNIFDSEALEHSNTSVVIPNANLSTEHILSYELGAKWEGPRFAGSAFVYRNALDDYLVRTPALLNGLPFYDQDRNGVQDPTERQQILQNQNIGAGTIRGVELDGSVRMADAWTVLGNYTLTRGTNTVFDTPLPAIPPAFGMIALRFSPASARAVWGELLFRFAGAQHRLDPVESTEYGAGTDAARVWNIRGGFNLRRDLVVTAELQNLLDEAYRYHDSLVYEPGRQVIVSAQYRFSWKKSRS